MVGRKFWVVSVLVVLMVAGVAGIFLLQIPSWEKEFRANFKEVRAYLDASGAGEAPPPDMTRLLLELNHYIDAKPPQNSECYDWLYELPPGTTWEGCQEFEDDICEAICYYKLYILRQWPEPSFFDSQMESAKNYIDLFHQTGFIHPHAVDDEYQLKQLSGFINRAGAPDKSEFSNFAAFALFNYVLGGNTLYVKEVALMEPQTEQDMLFYSRIFNSYYDRRRI